MRAGTEIDDRDMVTIGRTAAIRVRVVVFIISWAAKCVRGHESSTNLKNEWEETNGDKAPLT